LLPSKKHKVALERLQAEDKINFTKRSDADFVDMIDERLRIAFKQYRELLQCSSGRERSFKKASLAEKTAIETVRSALIIDGAGTMGSQQSELTIDGAGAMVSQQLQSPGIPAIPASWVDQPHEADAADHAGSIFRKVLSQLIIEGMKVLKKLDGPEDKFYKQIKNCVSTATTSGTALEHVITFQATEEARKANEQARMATTALREAKDNENLERKQREMAEGKREEMHDIATYWRDRHRSESF
jgi:hypothetical protein